MQLQLHTSFLSHQVSIFTHLHSVHFSALCMHYPQRKTLQRASVVCYITDDSWRNYRLLHHGWLLAQLSSATSRITLGAIIVCYITDGSWRKCRLLDHGYNAVAMTLGPAAILCPVFCTGSWQKMTKVSKRVKYCGYTHTPRPPPDEGGDVCKVRLRSVQKCGFV